MPFARRTMYPWGFVCPYAQLASVKSGRRRLISGDDIKPGERGELVRVAVEIGPVQVPVSGKASTLRNVDPDRRVPLSRGTRKAVESSCVPVSVPVPVSSPSPSRMGIGSSSLNATADQFQSCELLHIREIYKVSLPIVINWI